MRIRTCIAVVCAIIFWLFPKPLYASNFYIDSKVTYDITEEGKAKVTHNIGIENINEAALPKGYVLRISNINPYNIAANEDGNEIFSEIKKTDSETQIQIHFQKLVNGVGKKKSFSISYQLDSVAVQSGEIWELSIPKVLDATEYRSYTQTMRVPETFGEEAYLHPQKDSTSENGKKVYVYDKNDILTNNVNAAFGRFKVFTFNLGYHLKNDSYLPQLKTIAIPPDTSVQKVYLDSVEPKYSRIEVDDDGNWIATYNLLPYQKMNIKVSGHVQLFASPRKLHIPKPISFVSSLRSTKYWQSTDPEIVAKAKELQTPENIYNYAVNTLTYNYTSATPSRERKGASIAFKRPDDAICMEFTDLFIALARAAGIPAREMNGYAYSENPKIQPLSLVSDVLHSWPEYWDNEKNVWVPVDPTWGNTTGGGDYFNTFDLNHVAFVIHGSDDTNPLPAGSYKSLEDPKKDVFVTISETQPIESSVLGITHSKKIDVSLTKSNWDVLVSNNGNTALYEQNAHVYFDSEKYKSFFIPILPPGGSYAFNVEANSGILAMNLPEIIAVYGPTSSSVLSENKRQSQLTQIAIIGSILLCFILIPTALVLRRRYNYETNLTES